jgi:hypothetical protein
MEGDVAGGQFEAQCPGIVAAQVAGVDGQSVAGDDFFKRLGVPLADVEQALGVEELRAAGHFDDGAGSVAAEMVNGFE